MIPLNAFLTLSAFLLCAGLFIVITRRNAIMLLMGIELILNSANLNLLAFNRYLAYGLSGQLFAIFVIVLAACEVVVALAFVLAIYRYRAEINLDALKDLHE